MENLLKIGDKIGRTYFTIKKIVKSVISRYTKGRKIRVKTTFYLIENSKGHKRVLNSKKNKVSQSEQYYPTFGNNWKYITWDMFKYIVAE